MSAEIENRDPEKLKLRAHSPEDLLVVSACLQDAVVSVGDMTYVPRERRFVFMANRFLWEDHCEQSDECRRIRTGIHFDDVLKVSVRGIPQKQKNLALELLAVEVVVRDPPAATVLLVFAGDGIVRLDVECITCHLSDVGKSWCARCRPRHAVVENAG